MMMTEQYAVEYAQEAYELLKTLARIPAPSNHEEKRSEFCKQWLLDHGVQNVTIDEALNVQIPFEVTDDNPLTVIMAHLDVVFPDMTELPLKEEAGRLCAPGVGDDTANLVVLLMAARYLTEKKLTPTDGGVLLVCNSGEEGLGNLKGCRHIMKTYGHRVKELISLDGGMKGIVSKAVGSKRYRVEICTEGGHSYGAFGNRNAIAYMAALIDSLYSMKVPQNGRTTYNVGTISGGTSVNTIAQQCEILYEFRSDAREDLTIMDRHFEAAIEYFRAKGVTVNVELLGERPCGAPVDEDKQAALMERCQNSMSLYNGGVRPQGSSGSTDCNIPLSMGIPSACFGCYSGHGAHTREEYVETDSLLPGFKLGLHFINSYFGGEA